MTEQELKNALITALKRADEKCAKLKQNLKRDYLSELRAFKDGETLTLWKGLEFTVLSADIVALGPRISVEYSLARRGSTVAEHRALQEDILNYQKQS